MSTKIDKTVWKETLYVTIGTLGLSAVMLLIYSLLYSFELKGLYGALFGSVAAILNFFFMAYTLQKTVEIEHEEDESEYQEKIKAKVKGFYAIRSTVYLLVLVAAIISKFFNVFTLLIPCLFPQIVARVRMFWLNKHGEE
jgi:C4-dicarboxylate transporter